MDCSAPCFSSSPNDRPTHSMVQQAVCHPAKQLRLCIWMNIPSPYQSALFAALLARADVDLKVMYLEGESSSRGAEGWESIGDFGEFECFWDGGCDWGALDRALPCWQGRVHIIAPAFSPGLDRFLTMHGVSWAVWTEMHGIGVARLVGFSPRLTRLAVVCLALVRRARGAHLRRHALGVLAQGRLARRSYRLQGVPDFMIGDLFYSPASLYGSFECKHKALIEFGRGRRLFLSVGALSRRKGTDLLIRAFARLHGSKVSGVDDPNWGLVLCGLDRSGGKYERLARQLGVRDKCLFLGPVSSSALPSVYLACSVHVLASRFDGWGVVSNEAASCALPLIGTEMCGSSWHVIEDGVTGFRVAATACAIAGAMSQFVNSEQLIKRMGSMSKRRFEQLFSPERNAERLSDQIRGWLLR